MSNTKKVSEEELERQYEDYRAQFEQWKEANKSSVGTDAYNSYVSQFEQWEKEVEARKAQQRNHRRVGMDEKDKEAAVAYASSQESYVQHHMKAMVHEIQQRAAVAAAQHHQQLIETQRQVGPNSATAFSNGAPITISGVSSAQANSNQTAQGVVTPPSLWGNPKPVYDSRDAMFAKWGERGSTAHSRINTEDNVNPVACWMLLDALRERKMVLAPHSNNVPPPHITSHNHNT